MLRKLAPFVLFLMLMSAVPITLAGNGGALTPGELVSGEIAQAGEQDVYTYEGLIGELVTITLNALPDSNLDTFLEVYDPFGTLVAQNDDANQTAGNTNSEVRLILPYDGQYQVVARGFARSSTGAYELMLNMSVAPPTEVPPIEPPPTEPPPPTIGSELTLNQTVTGNLSFGQSGTVWTFTPTADLTIQISLTSADFDTLLEVYDSNTSLIATDDDGGADLNSLIYSLPVIAGETYDIRARSYADEGEGSYTLLVSEAPPLIEQQIAYGETADGFLNPGEMISYNFEGSAGDVISVRMTGGFDAYLELRDTSSNLIVSDDDSGGNFLPALTNISLSESGTHYLIVSGYDASSTGTFTLELIEGEIAPVTPLESQPLTVELPATGDLPPGQTASFRFTGTAGDAVTLEVSASFDTLIELYDPNGNYLTYDDDSGGEFNPLISDYILPADGDYEVLLRGFSSDVSGSYTLTLTIGTSEPIVAQPISYEETVTGNLVSDTSQHYSFEGTANDEISVAVESDFDTVLQLTDSSGAIIATDDDSGGNGQPLMEGIILPETDTYTLTLRGYSSFEEGDFSLTLTQGTLGTPTISGDTTPISYGETAEQELEPGTQATFVFTANAGDSVTISATSEYDGYLELYDAAGTLVASDDDGGDGFNPLIQDAVLPAAGDYQIIFSSFGGQGRGAFSLTLTSGATTTIDPTPTPTAPEVTPTPTVPDVTPTPTAPDVTPIPPETTPIPTEAQTVNAGTPVTATLPSGGMQRFTFEGTAGETVSIAAAPSTPNNTLDLYFEVYAPSGTLLTTNDDGGWRYNPALVGFELPESGTYAIEVRDFSGTGTGDFVLSFERGAVSLTPNGTPASTLEFADGQAEISVSLAANEIAFYSFAVAEGEAFTINPNGATVEFYAVSDGTDYLADGSLFTSPFADTYVLVLYSETGGAVTVQISTAQPPVTVVEPIITASGALLPDVPVQGSIQPNETQQWTFTPLQSGQYTFVLNSEDPAGRYDPYLRLIDVNGAVLAEDDDKGGNFNALIADQTLIGGLTVTVEVTSYAGQIGGAYFLAVVTESIAEVPAIAGGELIVDTATPTVLEMPGQQAEFTFALEEAGTFSFTIEGLTLPYIEIYDEAGTLIGRGAALLKSQALEAGTYKVVVFDRLNKTGEFTLTVTPE